MTTDAVVSDNDVSAEVSAMDGTLRAACASLERRRSLLSELEAGVLFSSTLLSVPLSDLSRFHASSSHDNTDDAGLATLPGGVADAHGSLVACCFGDDNDDTATGGRLAEVCRSTALSTACRRAADVSGLLRKSAQEDKATYARAKDTLSTSASLEPWFEALDRRSREVRAYHARHDTHVRGPDDDAVMMPAFPTMPDDTHTNKTHDPLTSTSTTITQPRKKRARSGNPEADGYDLSSVVSTACKRATDGSVFSGEEVLGRYLDLNLLHDFVVQKGIHEVFQQSTTLPTTTSTSPVLSYVEFLAVLSHGLNTALPEREKLQCRKKYVRFLSELRDYSVKFFAKTSPLLDVQVEIVTPAVEQFEEEWRACGGATGWKKKEAERGMVDDAAGADNNVTSLDLTPFDTPAALEQGTDKDVLKTELSRLGLKCGGTPLERARRLFLTKNTPLDKLPKKLFAKKTNTDGSTDNNDNNKHHNNERRVDVARLESVATSLLRQLRPTLDATARRAERRLTQTANERERENHEEVYGVSAKSSAPKIRDPDDSGDESDSDDSDTPIYNPKGVPLGWDGKPIPYWLFKLHGLNHFFPCEICGNESYRGRRNFEKHFTESRHAHGMRCLGIPNTKHFHGVTRIEDAKRLWASLEVGMEHHNFDGNRDEEYEDSHGNVLNRGEYEDLARQGLL